MKIFLPLLYTFLILTNQLPEKQAVPLVDPVLEQEKKALFHRSVFTAGDASAPASSASASCSADPTLVDSGAGTFGAPFMNCSSVSTFYTLQVSNNSATKLTNKSYRIDWGDGTAAETFDRNFATASHTYTKRGAFNLVFTAIDNSGCETSRTYRVFNISNPGFSIGNPGSTTACLTETESQVTFRFPVTTIESNPPSTIYTFTFDDGSPNVVYTHEQMLALGEIVHTFTKSSCEMPNQSFSIRGVASYTCGGSVKSTPGSIEGIIINKSTNADFTIGGGPLYCAGNTVTLGNATNNPELCPISFNWSILDGVEGVDWVYTSGNSSSSGVSIKFIKAGKYRIRLKTFTDGCGEDEVIKEIEIREAARADFGFSLDKSSGCEDLLVSTTNTSSGYNLAYSWSVKYHNNNASQPGDYSIQSGSLTGVSPKFLLKKVGNYKIILTASNGCSTNTIEKEVTVKGTPTVSFKEQTVENCGPFTADYNGALNTNRRNGTISKYTWNVDNGASFADGTHSSSTNPKINFPAAGTYTVRVTIENECGSSSTAAQTVTVNAFPAAPAVDGLTACINDKPTLRVNSPVTGYTYRWYDKADATVAISTGTSFVVTEPLQNDTRFYVEAVSAKGCTSQSRTEVEIKVLSAITNNTIRSTRTTPYCEGAVPAKLEGELPAGGAGGNYSYLWQISTNGTTYTDAPGANTEKDYTPSAPITQKTWFRRKVENGPCQAVYSNAVELLVTPIPAQPIVPDASVCYGQNVRLEVVNVQANTNYYWYDAPTGGNMVRAGTIHSVSELKATTKFYVQATSNTNPPCATLGRTEVTVTVTPAMEGGGMIATPKPVVCYNTSPGTLTGAAPTGGAGSYTYKWYASTTGSTSGFAEVSSGTDPGYTPPTLTQTTWFKRVAISGSCDRASNVVEVRVENLPAAPTVSGTTLICSGSGTKLTATAPGGTYHWYAAADDQLLYTGTELNITSLTGTASYYVVAESALGCLSPRTTVTVTVAPAIANNSIGGNQTICSGSTPGSLSGSLPTGGDNQNYTYLWEYSHDGVNFDPAPGSNSAQNYTPTGNFTQDTWFRRKASSAPCSEAVSNLVKITVTPLPAAPVVAGTEACYGERATLTVENQGEGVRYKWYDQAAGGALLFTGPTYQTPVLLSSVTYYVEAVTDNALACVNPERTTVVVSVTPLLSGGNVISTPTPVVCTGGTPGTLDGAAPTGGTGAYSYQWYASTTGAGSGFTLIESATSKNYAPEELTQDTWFKRVVSSGNCSNESIVVKVAVEEAPAAPTVTGNRSVCSGGKTTLYAIAPGGTYRWYNSDNLELKTGHTFETPALTATTTYFVEVQSPTGCVSPRTAVVVEVTAPIEGNLISSSQVVCPGDAPAALTSAGAVSGGAGSSYTYRWEQSVGGSVFLPADGENTLESYSPPALSSSTVYRRIVRSAGCESVSNTVTITISNTISGNRIFGSTTVCAGSSPGTLYGDGDVFFSYQWYASTTSASEGFTAIPAATGKDYTPEALSTPTWYRRAVTSGNCSSISNTIFVDVQRPVTNNSISASANPICYNTLPGTLSGSAPEGGSGSYTYLWQWAKASDPNSYTDAPGSNRGQDYTPPAALTEAVYYRRIVASGECAQHTSIPVLVEVQQPIVNEISNPVTTLCENSLPGIFSSSRPLTSGDPNQLRIRWMRSHNGGSFTEVATTEAYQPTTPLTAGTWQYKRMVQSGSCAEVVSNTITIVVNPSISGNTLAAQSPVCRGSMVMLSPMQNLNGGDGTNYRYQWQQSLDGTSFTDIDGAVAPTHSQVISQPTSFRRIVTSGTCTSTSPAIAVQVQDPIENTISADQTLCVGTPVAKLTGTTLAGGSGNYTFEWQVSTSGIESTFTAAPGVNTQADYQPTNVTQPTWFRRKVTGGACGEVYSNAVQIRYEQPIVNQITGTQTICLSSTAAPLNNALPVSGGNGALTYQWQSSADGSTFQDIIWQTGAVYEPNNLQETTWFRRIIRSASCESVSNKVQVTVQPRLAANDITNTGSSTVCYNAIPAQLTGSEPSGGAGSGTYTYLWQWAKASDPNNFSDAPGTNNRQDYLPTQKITEAVYFRRIVLSGECAQLISNTLLIEIFEPVVNEISTPVTTLCANSTPEAFSSSKKVSGGNGDYAYRWERSHNGGSFTVVATTENYEPTDALAAGTWRYRRIVKAGDCAETTSNTITITVNPAISGNVLAAPAPVCTGTTVELRGSSALSGGDNVFDQFQWQQSVDGVTFNTIAGATQATYRTTVTENTWFRRIVSSGTCTNTSEKIEVKVQQPIVNRISGSQTLCVGAAIAELGTEELTGGNGDYSYTWEMSTSGDEGSFVRAPGISNSEKYQPGHITKTTWFRRKVTAGACAAAYSNAVKVTFYQPIINHIASNQTICQGQQAALLGSLTSVLGGDGNYKYQWQQSTDGVVFTDIVGENTAAYLPGALAKRTWFRRVVTAGCTSESNVVEVDVLEQLSNNTINTATEQICYNTKPALITGSTPKGGRRPYTYTWEKSENGTFFSLIPGAVAETYQPDALKKTTWFRRTVRSEVCGELRSNVVRVQVDLPIADNYIMRGDQTVCSGTQPSLLQGSAPTGGSERYTYLWLSSTQGPSTGFGPAPGVNTQASYQPPVLTRTTWYKRVVYSSPCQEHTSAAVKVEAIALPGTPTAPDVVVCTGNTATLSGKAGPGETLEWYDAAQGGRLLFAGPEYNTPPLTADKTYYVQAVNRYGCTSPSRHEVRVQVVTPKATASDDVLITEGKSVQLFAQGGATYEWSPAEGLSDPSSASPFASPLRTTTYTVTVTTAEGCVDTEQVTVTVLPKVQASNVITMNGDGLNDKFIIKNIESYPDCHVKIFNRWGEMVFESRGYKEPWDGTKNGQPLPMAAYYYIIHLNNQEEPVSGSITIIK